MLSKETMEFYVPCGLYVPIPVSTVAAGRALLQQKDHEEWLRLGVWVYAGPQPFEGATWHVVLLPNPTGTPTKIFCESQAAAHLVVYEHNLGRSLGDPDAFHAMMDMFFEGKKID